MALTAQQRIRLQELLLKREALYARVYQTEQKIHQVFGETYPLTPPPIDLPSANRQKTKPKRAAKKKSAPPRIRNLIKGETAYRVRYGGATDATEETHTDRKSIEVLLRIPAVRSTIASIETIDSGGKLREFIFPPTD
ncbi:MAG: hypothetical protein AAFX93_08755 [Verrucomicrobiota bacterium]